MTQTSAPTPPTPRENADPAPAGDVQRQSLDHLVRLSIACTAEEQRIDQQHAEALETQTTAHQKKARSNEHAYQRRVAELLKSATQREEAITTKYNSQRQALDTEHQNTLQQLARERKEAESALKKEMEAAAWQAESVQVAFEIKVDAEEQKAQQDLEASKAELASLDTFEQSVNVAMARCRTQGFPVEVAIDAGIQKRLSEDRLKVLAEKKGEAEARLHQVQALSQGRAFDDLLPIFLTLVVAVIAAVVGWLVPPDEKSKLITAGSAAGGTALLCILVFVILGYKKRARIRTAAKDLYVPLMHALGVARKAAWFDAEAAAAERNRRVKEGRQKRDAEVNAARERAKTLQSQAAEKLKTALADESARTKEGLAALEREKARGLEELQRKRDKLSRQYEEEDTTARTAADEAHASAVAVIEADYARDCQALEMKWSDGLRALNELIAAGAGIDPDLVNWNSPAWERWTSPESFSGKIRFGEMKVDLAQLTERVPKRLQLPGTFRVPAMLTLPTQASLYIESDHTGRTPAIELAQMVMARLLTQMPAGRVKFTLFDPVGLGQSFAGFMHLADHDESLVGSRIWTEKEHIQQRLADLTEHMETVIQKYLRNEYATIDQYNAQAGELAEPIRYLVLADFPTGFEPEALRRLQSIATTGARCGVYTIILRDSRQPLPPGSHLEDLVARSVHLVHKNGAFSWNDAVFKQFPLTIDPAPDEKTLTVLMDLVGRAAKDAKRVEVPFDSIAPTDDQFWSLSSKNTLRVPIGKSGATRLQALRMGVGVAQHALVAGKTGSGKSNLMHTIVTNLAMWYSPDEVEFYLVDFKKGVEFKAYVSSELPHARAIAVESDREFGISVLQRVDAELTRRGTLFRDAGVQDITAYRDATGQKLPRTVLLVDEFQEFFSEEDKLSQDAAGLLDRLVRQGRAFGVHLVLGSQSIGGTSGLGRSTLGQIAIRVALQCTEADSQLILGDNNSAARLLTRPGEAVYNDAGGLVEANSPFQIAFLPNDQRERYLEKVHAVAQTHQIKPVPPIVFEGNTAAAIRKNHRLVDLLERSAYPTAGSTALGFVGEPVAIKEPTAVPFRRQAGANVLLVGQQEESAVALFASMTVSLAAQNAPAKATFVLLDGTPADSRYAGLLERVAASLPHETKVVSWRQTPEAINELSQTLHARQAEGSEAGPSVYVLLFGLQRYRLLRQEEDFSFSRDEDAAPKPGKQFAELLAEGPAHGIHTLMWADTPIAMERTLDRASTRQFDFRILFQMSASDSSNLIDSPLANRLGTHRALLYSEEQGTFEKFRPYELPDDAWLSFISSHLRGRPA